MLFLLKLVTAVAVSLGIVAGSTYVNSRVLAKYLSPAVASDVTLFLAGLAGFIVGQLI